MTLHQDDIEAARQIRQSCYHEYACTDAMEKQIAGIIASVAGPLRERIAELEQQQSAAVPKLEKAIEELRRML